MSVQIVFDNLGELADDLRRLPDQVQVEGSGLVHGAARAFAALMQARFPKRSRTGHLAMNTQLLVHTPLKAEVYNQVFYAGIVEGGFLHPQAQRWIEGQNIWVPQAMRTRAEMIERLREIVTRGRGLHLRALEVIA